MIGYRKIFRIMAGVVIVYIVLNFLVLRDTPFPILQILLNILFMISGVVLFILLMLNRYRP